MSIALLIALLIFAGGDCPAAPVSRLESGMMGRVSVDRLNLRLLPAVGAGSLGPLYSGESFTVLDGPACNGGYAWWRVEMRASGVMGWLAEADWDMYYLAPTEPPPPDFCALGDAPWSRTFFTRLCQRWGLG